MMFRNFLATTRLVRFYSRVHKSGVYGLTEKEIADLRAVWKVVEEAPLPVSKLFFKELFDKKPEYQKKFDGYTGRPLIHNNEFVPHMRAVVVSLNKIIRKLEDEKTVNQVMDYVTTAHKGTTVYREEFVEMGKSVKTTLRELNKKKFTSEMEAAFDKFWAAMVEDFVRRIDVIHKDMPKPPQRPHKK